jgi:hypothetical protein
MRTQLFASILVLTACGRPVTDADVRLVGVGNDPDQIGPAPIPYGGVVGYDHVELAGGGLALAHMGLGSFDEVGPGIVGFAPPYDAVIGFSYLFDQKLPAASTLTFTAPVPPSTPDTCYTVVEPEGPIGSFNTVDVGDYMAFTTADGANEFKMGRVPADLPPKANNLFVYYSTVEPYAPTARTHLVPGADPTDASAMVEEVWKKPNYPYGQEMIYHFPGGYTRFDQGISSIPRPSGAASTGSPKITLPQSVGGVLMSWNGPQYDENGGDVADGEHTACIEYYGAGRVAPPGTPADCLVPGPIPNDDQTYDSFPGQIYTGPWDSASGVNFQWTPTEADDTVALAVRFMAPVDPNDPNYLTPQVPGDDGYRSATMCEQDDPDAEMRFDQSFLDDQGNLARTLQGDPFSRMVEVSCLLADDGDYTLDNSQLTDAMAYLATHQAGGAIFFFSRGTKVEADVPDAKDLYDQLHEITPIVISSKDVKIGRFQWNGAPATGGAE